MMSGTSTPLIRSIHHIHHSSDTKLLAFDPGSKPLFIINSGEEVTFDNTNADFKHITQSTTDKDLQALDLKGIADIEHCMGAIYVDGPVYVRGAEPGDTLKVEILELQTADWGWTAIFPGLGLLSDEFPGPHIKTFSLSPDGAIFKDGKVHIPAAPFYGTMGVAPPESVGACHPLFPRNDMGGNFDCRYLGVGASMYLPINIPGALFSVGDAHFSQGDGEITGTALETTMRSRIRLTVIRSHDQQDLVIRSPHYDTNPDLTAEMHKLQGKGEHGVLATASTRVEAIKTAVRGCIQWMETIKGLTPLEGYMLFSIAGNLKMHHDLGLDLFTVSASVPLGLFLESSLKVEILSKT